MLKESLLCGPFFLFLFYGNVLKAISHTVVLTCLTSDFQALVTRMHMHLEALPGRLDKQLFHPGSWHQNESLITLAADMLRLFIFVVLL